MPISHDGKPRNRGRREKHQKTLRKQNTVLMSPRSFKRRLLRQTTLNVQGAQRRIETALREKGVRWRELEKAVAEQVMGQWSRLADIRLPAVGLLRDYFADLEAQQAEAA